MVAVVIVGVTVIAGFDMVVGARETVVADSVITSV